MPPSVEYVPQFNAGERITYTWDGEVLTAEALGLSELIDFADLPDGASVSEFDPEVLPFSPVLAARREGGQLFVSLLEWYGEAPEQETEVVDEAQNPNQG